MKRTEINATYYGITTSKCRAESGVVPYSECNSMKIIYRARWQLSQNAAFDWHRLKRRHRSIIAAASAAAADGQWRHNMPANHNQRTCYGKPNVEKRNEPNFIGEGRATQLKLTHTIRNDTTICARKLPEKVPVFNSDKIRVNEYKNYA